MHAELLAIGAEIVSGQAVNTNVAYLARRLQDVGIACDRHTAVSDDRGRIVQGLREAVRRAPLVITTGGLGPTFDDITMDAIAQATGRRLILVPRIASHIRRFYRMRRRRLNRLALRQAALPEGGIPLPNPVGTAPGVWLPLGSSVVVALPGVPSEMRAIMEHSVLPRLRRHTTASAILSRTLRTVGIVELDIQALLRRLRMSASVQVGLYPQLRAVDVRFTVSGLPQRQARRLLDRLERQMRRRLGPAVYGIDGQTLEGAVGEVLVRRRKTLAVAESCTGGLLSDQITNVPGSSRYFLLSVVTYHNRTKRELLGVTAAQLARHGAVSAPVARAMAQGVRRLVEADVALAVTGIAGPTGGTPRKPVGLVYLALADRRRSAVRRCRFHGDRRSIKFQTAQVALDWLRHWVLGSAEA